MDKHERNYIIDFAILVVAILVAAVAMIRFYMIY